MARAIRVDLDPQAYAQLKVIEGSLRTLDKAALKEFRLVIRDEFIDPLANRMRTAALVGGRHGPRLARTIRSTGTARLRIGSMREPVWAGAEFGGRSGKKKAQFMRWGTTRKVIYRRQTMQFLEHRGTRGYFAFPAWRRHNRELTLRLIRAMDNFVADYTGGE